MSRRTRYRQGSVQREKRQSGPDVWIFRWREAGPDGSGKQRKAIVGTVESLTTEAAALKAAHVLRVDANQQAPLAEGEAEDNRRVDRSLPTQRVDRRETGTKGVLDARRIRILSEGWIVPRWGDHNIEQVRLAAVEEWLDSIKWAKGSKAKIRNI
jgi:hypothetical protein